MPLFYLNQVYPDGCEVIEANGRKFLCYPRGFSEFKDDNDPQLVADRDVPSWARWAELPLGLDFDAEVAVSVQDAEEYSREKMPTPRQEMFASAIAIADDKVKDTKRDYERAAQIARLDVAKSLPAAQYKNECRKAAIDKLKRYDLRSGEEM
tara:strand:- start:596 stop:1051 length:456 start_codon:yes stop_codon:yes gene_type:complete